MVGSTIRRSYDAGMRSKAYAPEPPVVMPPARTLAVPGRGELFFRDSGGDRPPVMLLHGWTASADLNWWGAYDDLIDAGYRVLAIDHRGHGRGLRAQAPFRLVDCAADAAALLRTLELAPAIVVGYSMGGTIAQLMARDHRDAVSGMVLSGTSQHFSDRETAKLWKWMGFVQLSLSLAPRGTWTALFRRAGLRPTAATAWFQAELTRNSARDLAEAGRELGRFDSRPWLGSIEVPAASVITARDTAVSPRKQRELAIAAGATVFEVPLDHLELTNRHHEYNPALLGALEAVRAVQAVKAA
jgi:3-oxoadipate enol-lactonase